MEISLSSNSITDDHIATKFGTCHDSPAVVPCAKYCSDHFISIWMGAKWNFHRIWIVMEKLLVKWAPGSYCNIYIKYINFFAFCIIITANRWQPSQMASRALGWHHISCDVKWALSCLISLTTWSFVERLCILRRIKFSKNAVSPWTSNAQRLSMMFAPHVIRTRSQYKDHLSRYGYFHYKYKMVIDHLIFIMGIPI